MENDIVDDEKILGLCPGEAFGQNLGEMSRFATFQSGFFPWKQTC